MSNDKSLRDIWSVADKLSLDVLRSAGGVPESCNASVITTASGREKCESYVSNETQESYLKKNFGKQPIPCGLFPQPPKESVDEDDTMSLISSIWTPTIKDECVVKKEYQQNPLLVVKIPGKADQLKESENTTPLEDSYETLLEISSDSELSNNCGSDESQDELNDETFGESDSAKSPMTLCDISESTKNCKVLKEQPQNENDKKKKIESTDSDHSDDTIIEKNGDKPPKNDLNACVTRVNSETQTRQSKGRIYRGRNRPRGRRNVDTKALSSKFSHLGMESDEVLSVSRENLTIQESHSSSRNGGRMSNVKRNIAIETREVKGKKGTTKKITYVRGKIVEETNGNPNKNVKWNTDLCNLKIQSRNAAFPDSSVNRTPQTKLIEANSNRLCNSRDSFRQAKNGRLVFDDCLKMNGDLNFIRQDRRIFTPTRKDFEILKKEANKDALYEPRYKSRVENVRDNRNSTIKKNILPNYPSKVTNRAHFQRKIINSSQNHKESLEEDMRSEISWNIVTPEKDIQRNTMNKTFVKGTPTQTFSENLSKTYQAGIEANRNKKTDQMPKLSQNDKSYNDLLYDRYNFNENLKTAKKEEETETIPKFVPKSVYQSNQVKKSDQLSQFAQNDKSYDQLYNRYIFHGNQNTIKNEEETETLPKCIPYPSYQTNQVRKSDQLPQSSQNNKSYDQLYDRYTLYGNQNAIKNEEETETRAKFVPDSLYQSNQVRRSGQLPQSSQNDKSCDQLYDRYAFHGSLNIVKKEGETGTYSKFPKIPEPPSASFCATENLSFMRSAKLKEERAQKKSLLIKDGREVADLIVGCHTALDVFSSFYHEWLALRKESIDLLEKIMVKILKCASNNEKIKNVISGLNIEAGAAGFIPHKEVTLGAKIAAAIGSFVTKLFGNEFNEKDQKAKEFEVRQVFQRDIDTSSMVYIYGVQCSSQFEETCLVIKKLHQRTQDSFELFMSDTSVINFLKEISEYNPSNVTVFYKRLRIEYERLIKNSKSDESRAFIRVFEVVPRAVPVIDLLPWKFEPDGFDNSIVQNAWEELFSLFNYNGQSSNDDFLRKVQNCLFFLKKEKAILQRNVQRLLK